MPFMMTFVQAACEGGGQYDWLFNPLRKVSVRFKIWLAARTVGNRLIFSKAALARTAVLAGQVLMYLFFGFHELCMDPANRPSCGCN